jgi:hypothetical protein
MRRNVFLLFSIGLVLATPSAHARNLANGDDGVEDAADGGYQEEGGDSGGVDGGADANAEADGAGADVSNENGNDTADDGGGGGGGGVVSYEDDLYDYANANDEEASAVIFNDDDLFDLFYGHDESAALRHLQHRKRLRVIFLSTLGTGLLLYGCFCLWRKKREKVPKTREEESGYIEMKGEGVIA